MAARAETNFFQPRFDGKLGRVRIIPTEVPYLKRVRVLNMGGKVVRTYLMDDMGVPYKDMDLSDLKDNSVLPTNKASQNRA